MPEPISQNGRLFTYRDYLTWPIEERWEIINGTPFNITPAPSVNHQRISRELNAVFYNYFKGKPCEVFAAPFDVRLPKGQESDEEASTVVQPDLSIICDPQKLDRRGCKGNPELIVEITSPSTLYIDLKYKLSRYEEAGIPEYWIVHPEGKTILVYRLAEDGRYNRPEVYACDDYLPVMLFPDLIINLQEIFSVITDEDLS